MLRRHPDEHEGFLYRGHALAQGILGHLDYLRSYVRNLAFSKAPLWEQQREINVDFHILYYGSLAGALAKLRRSIKSCSPWVLLELNVVTLAHISDDLSDVELLDENWNRLRAHGVDKRFLDWARKRILTQAHNWPLH